MRGCYGLGLEGIDTAGSPMHDLPSENPRLVVAVERLVDGSARPEFVLDDERAVLWLSDGTGWSEVDHSPLHAALKVSRDYDVEALLHPMLSGTFAVVNRWLGRQVFHAGAVDFGGRAWVLMGDKGMGKSTLVADLSLRGFEVFADDLVVVDSGRIQSGPAFVDLRPDAARALGVGRDLGVLGSRPRSRLDVPLASHQSLPLGGWVTLTWGDRVALNPVPLEQRLPVLLRNQAILLPPDNPRALLQFLAVPMFVLTRPRQWERQGDVASLLSSTLG